MLNEDKSWRQILKQQALINFEILFFNLSILNSEDPIRGENNNFFHKFICRIIRFVEISIALAKLWQIHRKIFKIFRVSACSEKIVGKEVALPYLKYRKTLFTRASQGGYLIG